jgi:hypothetical protein
MMFSSVWVLGVGRLMVPRLCVVDIPRMNVYVNGVLFPKNIYLFMDQLYVLYQNNYVYYTMYTNQSIGNAVFNRIKPMFHDYHIVCQNYWIEVVEGYVTMKLFFKVFDKELNFVRNLDTWNKINVFSGESTIFCKL